MKETSTDEERRRRRRRRRGESMAAGPPPNRTPHTHTATYIDLDLFVKFKPTKSRQYNF